MRDRPLTEARNAAFNVRSAAGNSLRGMMTEVVFDGAQRWSWVGSSDALGPSHGTRQFEARTELPRKPIRATSGFGCGTFRESVVPIVNAIELPAPGFGLRQSQSNVRQ